MNYREIIGPDELDWKVIPLDWKKIGKEELKMGTPMSKDGVEANDASCYGILMDDVQKDKHFQARVIVSGCVDFTKAEEYSGIKISAEAKKAIGKVWSQGGGGLTELPEGYPYKEQSRTEFAVLGEVELITDGDVAGMQATASEEFVIGEKYVLVIDGTEYEETAFSGVAGSAVIGNEGCATTGKWDDADVPFVVMTASFSGQTMLTISFPASYAGTHTVEIYKLSETIQPMAEEFMPLLTSPNGTKYQLTVSDDGTLSAVAVE